MMIGMAGFCSWWSSEGKGKLVSKGSHSAELAG